MRLQVRRTMEDRPVTLDTNIQDKKRNAGMQCRRNLQRSWFYLKYLMLVMISFTINVISLLTYPTEKQS